LCLKKFLNKNKIQFLMGKKLTEFFIPKKRHKIPLKRSMSGYETEMFILKNDGSIDHSDVLLPKAKGLSVVPECAKSMIEVLCLPHKRLSSTSLSLVNNLIDLNELARANQRYLYPFATYPGVNGPVFRDKQWYAIKRQVLGKERFEYAGKCCGYHQHYALPRGMYNPKTKFLNYKTRSKVKRTLIDSYNLLNAIDPVITVLLQSSPFIDGRHLAKDSRTVVYRGGQKLNFMEGLYGAHQFFGGLSPYKQTLSDLISTLKRKHEKWRKMLRDNGFGQTKFAKSENILHFSWNPVKVNPKGTLEYRGGDMNYMSNIFGVATMIKFALREIQRNFMLVVPMDIEMKEAFKVEGNLVFIPPQTVVRKEMQKLSAYEGLANKKIKIYTEQFFKFVKGITQKDYLPLLKPLKRMIRTRTTVSEEILKKARKKGYTEKIPESFAKEISVFYAEKFSRDLYKTKELLEKVHVD